MPFDPDAYLAESKGGFDPDAYLEEGSSAIGDFANSMVRGSSLGEHVPGGKSLGDLGTMIGSGIVAATSAPFSDQSMGEIYDQSMAASDEAAARREAIDAKSPMAAVAKDILGGVAMIPARAAETPVVPKRDPFTKPGGFAERTIAAEKVAAAEAPTPGRFQYPKDTPEELAAAEAASQAAAKAASREATMSKVKDAGSDAAKFLGQEGVEMLPYPLRRAIQLSRYLHGKYGK